MSNRLDKSLVAILLIISIGGHWAILQSLAWASMVIDYSKDSSLSVAVAKTFDGKHPCNLCKLVKTGKASESKQEMIKVKTKIDFWMPLQELPAPDIIVEANEFAPFALAVQTRGDSPPVPPPRFS